MIAVAFVLEDFIEHAAVVGTSLKTGSYPQRATWGGEREIADGTDTRVRGCFCLRVVGHPQRWSRGGDREIADEADRAGWGSLGPQCIGHPQRWCRVDWGRRRQVGKLGCVGRVSNIKRVAGGNNRVSSGNDRRFVGVVGGGERGVGNKWFVGAIEKVGKLF